MPVALFDGENHQADTAAPENVSHSESAHHEVCHSAETHEVAQSYSSVPTCRQPVEAYQLPSYEHVPPYQQPNLQYQGAPMYEAPTSSSAPYQAALSSEPEEPVEHMTARERFARRNRQAMESTSYGAPVGSLIDSSAISHGDASPVGMADSSHSLSCEAMDASRSTNIEALLKNSHHSDEDNLDTLDLYSANTEPNVNMADSNALNLDASDMSAIVAPRKKGSIFKSRAHGSDDNKKRLALYKHKWSDNQEGGANNAPQGSNAVEAESNGKIFVV